MVGVPDPNGYAVRVQREQAVFAVFERQYESFERGCCQVSAPCFRIESPSPAR